MAQITFEGGLNENEDAQAIECQEGWNFELGTQDRALKPRAPIDLKGTATLTKPINGIMQLIKKGNAVSDETTLVFEADATTPTVYEWDGGATFTSKRTNNLDAASKLRSCYWGLDEFIVITDMLKVTPLLKWDGVTCTRLKTNQLTGSAVTNVSIVESSGTYTINIVSHGYSSGDLITVADAVPSGLNGEYEITQVDANNFTFTTTAGIGNSTTHGTSQIGEEIFAKYCIVHNGRNWLFNLTTGNNKNPHMLVGSFFEDAENYSTSQRAADGSPIPEAAFYMLTPDLRAINGVALFNRQLIISTAGGRLFRLTGFDTTNYSWISYYSGSRAVGTETVANIGNDIVYMREGGNIESVIATDTSSDIQANDMSRWIQTTVKDLEESITVYDQNNQKVLFFVTGKVLVLFKDVLFSKQVSPWSVYKTSLAFNFNTNAAVYIRRPGKTTYSIYFGDDIGNIYDLNGSGIGDNSTTIITYRKTRILDEINFKNQWLIGRIQYRRIGDSEVTLSFDWSNEYNKTESTIKMKGPLAGETFPVYGGAYYYGNPSIVYGGSFKAKISHANFSPTGKADGVKIGAYLDTTVAFQIDNLEI